MFMSNHTEAYLYDKVPKLFRSTPVSIHDEVYYCNNCHGHWHEGLIEAITFHLKPLNTCQVHAQVSTNLTL